MSGISYGSRNVTFLIARTDAGYINDTPTEQAQELTTPGVRGRRWRTVFEQFEPFQLYTVIDAATYAAAIQTKRTIEGFAEGLARLDVTIAGANYSFTDVKVLGKPAAALVPFRAIGANATGQAHVICLWNLVLTRFDP